MILYIIGGLGERLSSRGSRNQVQIVRLDRAQDTQPLLLNNEY